MDLSSGEEAYHSAEEDGGGTTAREEEELGRRMAGMVVTEKDSGEDGGMITHDKNRLASGGSEPPHHTNVKEKDLAAVLGEGARVPTHNLSQVCPETEPQRHTVASEMDRRTEHTGGSVEATADSESAAETLEGEYVTGLDNRYVSEDATIKGDKVELTEEQIKEMREHANRLKKEGNEHFKSGDYPEAVSLYTEALKVYPSSCKQEVAVCYANRGACHMKMVSHVSTVIYVHNNTREQKRPVKTGKPGNEDEHQNVIDDCTKALELNPDYLKALMRRAQSYEALEKYEDALEDYKRVLELDPSQIAARQAVMYLPEKIKEQHEKLKDEMMGKLKELGDAILKPFGLSTQNFQLQQDPQSGGYSINFKR